MATWPATADELTQLQQALGELTPDHWQPPTTVLRIGACFVCFERVHGSTGPRVHGAGAAGDKGFAGGRGHLPPPPAGRGDQQRNRRRALPADPARHPRRAGLALHLGAVLGLPTVGVTTRPLVAQGAWPVDQRAATAPLLLDNEVVGRWVRTRAGARPVAVHASWQTDAQDVVQVVLAATRRARTPEPLRRARTLARTRRAHTR
jgi:deoxyribonuclease V